MKKMIPLVKPYIAAREEMLPAIEETLYSGYIAVGEKTEAFEQTFAGYLGNPYVAALNSGTAALHIALTLLDVGPGDEVISTAMTAEPTNTVILNTGAKVVWADADPKTGLMDPVDAESKITEHTKAIIVVHYAGMICDMKRFEELSKRRGIPVIEDAAHALGGRYGGKGLGNSSAFACFSFQAIKHMTTVDGGLIAIGGRSEDPERLCDEAKRLRFFGIDKKSSRLMADIKKAGYKYGMNNVTAAIGLVQMNHIGEIIEAHTSNGKYYDEALKGVPGVETVPYYQGTEPSYWLYTLLTDDRESFIKAMADRGITASPLHHRSDTHTVFKDSARNLPGLDAFYSRFVHIPCGWWVSAEDREYIADMIRKGW